MSMNEAQARAAAEQFGTRCPCGKVAEVHLDEFEGQDIGFAAGPSSHCWTLRCPATRALFKMPNRHINEVLGCLD